MIQRLLIACLIFFNHSLLGQNDLSIGQWKAHLPYQIGTSVTQSEDKIIYSTPWSIFTIDKNDMSVSFLSKVSGLSDIGIEKVRYDLFNDQLFIIYTNGNIDILRDNQIFNIPNIKLNTSIFGNKNISDVHFINNSQAFFSTSFGIVEFNNSNYNFGSTILTGISVNEITSFGSLVFAATDEGIYFIDQANTPIIADFNNWNYLGQEFGFPTVYTSMSITQHQNVLYAGVDNFLYKSENGIQWEDIHSVEGMKLEFIIESEDRLIAGWRGENFLREVLFFDSDDNFVKSGNDCIGVPLEVIRDESGNIWYADLFNNIRRAVDYTASCTQNSYNSPFSESVNDIVLKDNQVLVASGGVTENFNYLFSRQGFYLNNNDEWNNFNQFENEQINQFDLLNIFKVAFHPSLSKIYAASYWAGLLELEQENNIYTLFNKTNSTLTGSIGDEARERVSGLAFDEDENLWVSTYNSLQPINVLKPDGEWQSFKVPGDATLTDVIIDDFGYKWFTIHGSTGGILVYDSGESLQSTADDRFRYITKNNSELTTNLVLSMKKDLVGDIWVGTGEGPVIFDCGSSIFEDFCVGDRRKVLQDSIAAFLLADQQINVIEVDGADRKWLGTRNGLFVQSPLGDEQIAHFTIDNSPIFDNEIRALAYNGSNGEMWIGTNKGMLSMRTETTIGVNKHRKDEVYAYPNPVEPSYGGPIAIKGLVSNANVKITDINGLFVTELKALGGQAIWDRRDAQNRAVSSGVYLVFSSDVEAFDNPDAFVTKIMILK